MNLVAKGLKSVMPSTIPPFAHVPHIYPSILLLSSWFLLTKLSLAAAVVTTSGVVRVRGKVSSGSYHSLPPGSQLLTLFTLTLCSLGVNMVPVRHEFQCVKALSSPSFSEERPAQPSAAWSHWLCTLVRERPLLLTPPRFLASVTSQTKGPVAFLCSRSPSAPGLNSSNL